MRTSLIETQEIEHWILNQGSSGEWLLTDAKLILNKEFKDKARWQEYTYELVGHYGRQKLREEIRSIEKQLFSSPRYSVFQKIIKNIFNH